MYVRVDLLVRFKALRRQGLCAAAAGQTLFLQPDCCGVLGKHAAQDVDFVLVAHLTADVVHRQAHPTLENLEPVLGGPDQVMPMVENTMAAGVVLHGHKTILARQSGTDWKSAGLLQSVDTEVRSNRARDGCGPPFVNPLANNSHTG